MAASDNCCNLAQLSIIGRGLTVRSTRTCFVVSFKCVAICYIAGSQLSWQRVGLTQALGRRTILESRCFSHLKQSCLGAVHCFLLAPFYLQAARKLAGVLLRERRLSEACGTPAPFLVSPRLPGTSLTQWLARSKT